MLLQMKKNKDVENKTDNHLLELVMFLCFFLSCSYHGWHIPLPYVFIHAIVLLDIIVYTLLMHNKQQLNLESKLLTVE